MRVQFVWPNFDCPIGKSIGLSYLSSALKQAGPRHTRRAHLRVARQPVRSGSGRRARQGLQPRSHRLLDRRQPLSRNAAIEPDPQEGTGSADSLRRHSHHAECADGDDRQPLDRLRQRRRGRRFSRRLATALDRGTDTTRIGNVWARKNGELGDESAARAEGHHDTAVDGPGRLGVQADHREPPRVGQPVHEPRLPVSLHLLPQQWRRQGAAGGLRHEDVEQRRSRLPETARHRRHDQRAEVDPEQVRFREGVLVQRRHVLDGPGTHEDVPGPLQERKSAPPSSATRRCSTWTRRCSTR